MTQAYQKVPNIAPIIDKLRTLKNVPTPFKLQFMQLNRYTYMKNGQALMNNCAILADGKCYDEFKLDDKYSGSLGLIQPHQLLDIWKYNIVEMKVIGKDSTRIIRPIILIEEFTLSKMCNRIICLPPIRKLFKVLSPFAEDVLPQTTQQSQYSMAPTIGAATSPFLPTQTQAAAVSQLESQKSTLPTPTLPTPSQQKNQTEQIERDRSLRPRKLVGNERERSRSPSLFGGEENDMNNNNMDSKAVARTSDEIDEDEEMASAVNANSVSNGNDNTRAQSKRDDTQHPEKYLLLKLAYKLHSRSHLHAFSLCFIFFVQL